MALAHLAATVHASASAKTARAVTPLSLAVGRGLRVSNSAVGFFSARARHPDVLLAARAARASPGNNVYLLTQLERPDVASGLAAVVDEIVTLPRTTSDGFLATNSILAMATGWLLAAGFELPNRLPMLEGAQPQWPAGATRALVLYGPDQIAAASDLEARLSETGLVDVQLADLRNMAHGRHVGLMNRVDSTVVVTLGEPRSQALLDRTVRVLPETIQMVDLSTEIEGPVGALDAIAGSMRLVGSIAGSRGIDPGRPQVSEAGRRLYHLAWSRIAAGSDPSRPSRVKADSAGMAFADADKTAWEESWRKWRASVAHRRVRAVVLDYDGTCVPTPRRTSPPSSDVQSEIVRLLERGVSVAVASGRGPSVMAELRRWVPRQHWGAFMVGVYNGAVIKPLSEDIEGGTEPLGDLREAAALLEEQLVGGAWTVAARRWQITVERSGHQVADVEACVSSLLQPRFASQLKILRSGHSVDVVSVTTSKRSVVDHLPVDRSEVLLIGDRGEPGGNDFDLLSYSDLTLSVDQVSADASRCWNLSEDGSSGPILLAQYLRAVKFRGRSGEFSWKSRVV